MPYQVSTNIDESSSLGLVDGIKIVKSAWFGSIKTGKQFPSFFIVVQHCELLMVVLETVLVERAAVTTRSELSAVITLLTLILLVC